MDVQDIIHRVSKELRDMPGVVGVVLGGSRARGTNFPDSDIDIGIYYDEAAGFDVREVGKIASRLDDDKRENLVTGIGEWGPWVNGGGWLVVCGYHVDFIFRDINRVSAVIGECLQGKVTTHYHTGHPHAYLNVMYMGELAVCKILFERGNEISRLKAKTTPYPKQLKDAITGYFLFEASFSLMFARDYADKDDASYVMGHCFRTISCLNQVLFALNEEYCINEKKAVRMINGFDIKPKDYNARIDEVVSLISADAEKTGQGVELLRELVSETEMLVNQFN